MTDRRPDADEQEIDLDQLPARESGQVEWKENVADIDDVVKALSAFANDLPNLDGNGVLRELLVRKGTLEPWDRRPCAGATVNDLDLLHYGTPCSGCAPSPRRSGSTPTSRPTGS